MTLPRVDNRAILRVAIPALGALAIDPLLTLTDTAFVARLGVTELAALGVDTAILGFVFFGFNFLAYVTTPLVAQALGRGDNARARRWVGDAILLALILGTLTMVVVLVLAPWFVDLMGAGPEVAGPAVSYLRIRALATPAVLLVTTGHGAFRGHQDTRTPLMVALVVNVINVVLDPILIFVLGWGIEGAAIATILAQYVGAVWFLSLIRSRRMADRPAGLREALPSLLALGRNGILVSLRTAFLLIGLTFAAATATRLGAAEIGAYQVVMQVWLLAAMVADAFAIAGQAMVGEAVGAGDPTLADRLSRRLLLWGVVTGAILLLGFMAGAPLLAGIVDDPAVASLTVSAAVVAGWMMPLAAPLFVADGIFFGLLALGTVIASTGLGALTLIILLTATGLGDSLEGIWWAVAGMLVARGLVYLFRYRGSVLSAVRS